MHFLDYLTLLLSSELWLPYIFLLLFYTSSCYIAQAGLSDRGRELLGCRTRNWLAADTVATIVPTMGNQHEMSDYPRGGEPGDKAGARVHPTPRKASWCPQEERASLSLESPRFSHITGISLNYFWQNKGSTLASAKAPCSGQESVHTQAYVVEWWGRIWDSSWCSKIIVQMSQSTYAKISTCSIEEMVSRAHRWQQCPLCSTRWSTCTIFCCLCFVINILSLARSPGFSDGSLRDE